MFIHSVQEFTVSSMDIHGTNAYLRHIRKVHENDDRYGMTCPLCDSKFIYTDVKSVIHHLRKHTYRALHVTKTIAMSMSGLLQMFSNCLSSKLNISANNILWYSLNDDIQRHLFSITRNQESLCSLLSTLFQVYQTNGDTITDRK
jgi:hypothetical protein